MLKPHDTKKWGVRAHLDPPLRESGENKTQQFDNFQSFRGYYKFPVYIKLWEKFPRKPCNDVIENKKT